MIKVAKITFSGLNVYGTQSSKTGVSYYYYLTTYEDLKPGEVVVVQSKETITLGRFEGYADDNFKDEATKWIVERVNTSFHEEIKEKEEKRKQIKKQMEERYRKFSQVDMYRLIGKYDNKMARMLKEYDSLSPEPVKVNIEAEVKKVTLENTFS